jgi:hypothetical protein
MRLAIATPMRMIAAAITIMTASCGDEQQKYKGIRPEPRGIEIPGGSVETVLMKRERREDGGSVTFVSRDRGTTWTKTQSFAQGKMFEGDALQCNLSPNGTTFVADIKPGELIGGETTVDRSEWDMDTPVYMIVDARSITGQPCPGPVERARMRSGAQS